MEAGAVEGLVRCVLEGCISMMDMEIERRPYHRNCSCALHKTDRKDGFSKACSRCGKLYFSAKQSWSEGCLSLLATHSSSQVSSPFSSPARPLEAGGVHVLHWGPN